MKTSEYLQISEVIGRFKNGEERFKKSPLFNRVIQMLVRGVSEYEIIEQLIDITEDTIKAQEFYMMGDTRPISFKMPNQ